MTKIKILTKTINFEEVREKFLPAVSKQQVTPTKTSPGSTPDHRRRVSQGFPCAAMESTLFNSNPRAKKLEVIHHEAQYLVATLDV
ncbi:hypothetical protein F2Q70_00005009 [Brassica cretica]|uniref:Uncharacterized protein n=1 Tax=Brassica cretica TaxID=69181 RepID=A0A8S9IVG4_BRACR|nr:hypothetical protein F2Q70_00005009 [Brassica cretica]